MSDIKYEPTREHWTPYEPWMRDLLADDARVSWLGGIGERRQTWSMLRKERTPFLIESDARIHPDDTPERPAEDDPDEALAALIEPLLPCMPDQASSLISLKIARAAREHIEDSLKVYYRDLYEKAEADVEEVEYL